MNFALISEGVTDQPIIEAILESYLTRFPNDVLLLNPLQPKEKEPGGWTRVLEYCGTEEFRGAFDQNEYVIIQIDSDRHSDEGFDVVSEGTIQDLIAQIKARIIKSIGEEFYIKFQCRIIFAISVDQIECWFLPFYAETRAHKTKSINCCGTVNQYLRKRGFTLDCDKAEGTYKYYFEAAKCFLNEKLFHRNYSLNESLKHFVDVELQKISSKKEPEIE